LFYKINKSGKNTDLLFMRNIPLLLSGSQRAVVLFASWDLSHNPVVLKSIVGDFAVDVRHMPVDPGPSHLVVEPIDS
jgi:hypothetical protein